MSKKAQVNADTKKYCVSNIRVIETLMNESRAMLLRHGETVPTARKTSQDFVVEVCRQLQGGTMYFGKNSASDTRMKHLAIKDDFQIGNTIEQLATKYSLSTRQIHTIVHRKYDTESPKATTAGAPTLAILATRMMMKIGIEQDDAVSASRGLLAVVAAKLGGTAAYIPTPRFAVGIIKQTEIIRYYKAGESIESLTAHFGLSAEEIRNIIKNYPAAIMPDSSELPKIKTRLFNLASSFNDHPEIKFLLETAGDTVMQAQKAIKEGIQELNQ